MRSSRGSRTPRRLWLNFLRTFNDPHLTINVVSMHTTESLQHASAALYVSTRTSVLIVLNHTKLFRTAQRAAKCEPCLLRIFVSFGMNGYLERTVVTTHALRLDVQATGHCIIVAWCAVVSCATRADE